MKIKIIRFYSTIIEQPFKIKWIHKCKTLQLSPSTMTNLL